MIQTEQTNLLIDYVNTHKSLKQPKDSSYQPLSLADPRNNLGAQLLHKHIILDFTDFSLDISMLMKIIEF